MAEERLLDSTVIQKVEDLIDKLYQREIDLAASIIAELNQLRENSVYHEVGKLTRALHDQLSNMAGQGETTSQKLQFVVAATEKAANITIDGIEDTVALPEKLAEDAHGLLKSWDKFRNREMAKEDFVIFYEEMMLFLKLVEQNASITHNKLQEVFIAQDFQDLTGQVIKHVINTVSNVEHGLLKILQLGRQVMPKEEDSQESISTELTDPQQQVKGQAEIDDLLSELGF